MTNLRTIASYQFSDMLIEVVETGEIFKIVNNKCAKIAKMDLKSVNPTRQNVLAIISTNSNKVLQNN